LAIFDGHTGGNSNFIKTGRHQPFGISTALFATQGETVQVALPELNVAKTVGESSNMRLPLFVV
jgi:hypothetical protein